MKPYLLVAGILGAFSAGLLVGANNTQPLLVGGATGKLVFPEASPRAYVQASSGALTVAAGGTDKNLTLLSTGTGYVSVGNGASATTIIAADAAAGFAKALQFRTAGTVRWSTFSNATAESGADAGSDFQINRFDDAGAFLAAALFINRANGNIANTTTANYALDITGDTNTSGVFRKAGTAGISAVLTVRDSGGAGDCSITVSGGIITASTC